MGFERIELGFVRLDDKLDKTVLDHFMQHAKHLIAFEMYGYDDLPNTDRLNVLKLAIKIIKEQEKPIM